MEMEAMATQEASEHQADRLADVLGESGIGPGIDENPRMKMLADEIARLNEDLRLATSEKERMMSDYWEISRLLNVRNPDKLVHALRNVLNELNLLRIITKDMK